MSMKTQDRPFKMEHFALANPVPLSLKSYDGGELGSGEFALWPKSAFEGRKKAITEQIRRFGDQMDDAQLGALRRCSRVDHQSALLENFDRFDDNWDMVTYFIHQLALAHEEESDPRSYVGIKEHALLLGLGSKDDEKYQVNLALTRTQAVLDIFATKPKGELNLDLIGVARCIQENLIKARESKSEDGQDLAINAYHLHLLNRSLTSSAPSHLCGPFYIEVLNNGRDGAEFQVFFDAGKKELVGKPFGISESRINGLFSALMYNLRFTCINAVASNIVQIETSGNHLRKGKKSFHLNLPNQDMGSVNLTSLARANYDSISEHIKPIQPSTNLPFSVALSHAVAFFKEMDKKSEILMSNYYEAMADWFKPKTALEAVFPSEHCQTLIQSYEVSDTDLLSALSEASASADLFRLIEPAKAFAADEVAEEMERIAGISEDQMGPYSKSDLLNLALLFRAARQQVGFKLTDQAQKESGIWFQSNRFQDVYGLLCSNAKTFKIEPQVENVIQSFKASVMSDMHKASIFSEEHDQMEPFDDNEFGHEPR